MGINRKMTVKGIVETALLIHAQITSKHGVFWPLVYTTYSHFMEAEMMMLSYNCKVAYYTEVISCNPFISMDDKRTKLAIAVEGCMRLLEGKEKTAVIDSLSESFTKYQSGISIILRLK